MGMCETNAKLAHDFFKKVPSAAKLTSVQWRYRLIDELLKLYPPPVIASPLKRQRLNADLDVTLEGHQHVTRPLSTGEYVGRGAGTIDGFRRVKKLYQQLACQGLRCGKPCRTYCACNKHKPRILSSLS